MRERLQSVARVSAMLVSMAVLMGVMSVASMVSVTGLSGLSGLTPSNGLSTLINQFSFVGTAHANDIQVTNTAVADDSEAGVRVVSFDLSWENSWRSADLDGSDDSNAGNWDAAWVFVKYRTAGSAWKHARLTSTGHGVGTATGENMGEGAALHVGLVDQSSAYDASNNPGMGAMIYRGEAGAGRFAADSLTLRWNYAADGLTGSEEYFVEVYAVEMVYVAPGAFYAGSSNDGTEDARFVAGATAGVTEGSDDSDDSDNSTSAPFLVTSSWDGCVSDTDGCLWASGSMDAGGTLATGFPTGFSGFYGMKYEVSQQQYVDFLNSLPAAQATARAYVGGENRNGISYVDPAGGVAGYYTTSTPYVANNYMSWMDAAAYLDWAGMRPMTELEYEKASRGYAEPVADGYAWGSATISSTGGASNYSNLGEAGESVSQGNAVYDGSNPGGPARVGIFAGAATSREQAGAGYWGMMELSGNVGEMIVTVGNDAGRGFTGLHGDGVLSGNGEATVASWPGLDEAATPTVATPSTELNEGEVTGADGSGLRGGSLNDATEVLATAARTSAAAGMGSRVSNTGLRGARTIPAGNIFALTVQVSGDGEPNVGGTVSPSSGSYATGTEVELTATPAEGWAFSTWSGDVPDNLPDGATVTDSVLTITMDSDKSLTAEFSVDPSLARDKDTQVVDVVNPTTGATWMDRNLGASQAATSSTDAAAYGDLYQWGRGADGHQKRTSSTRTTLSSSDWPGHSDFILTSGNPHNWRSSQNDNLWQGADGINNPCPVGYRLPTEAEWDAERQSWSSNDSDGAYESSLKLPMAGYRSNSDGLLFDGDSSGNYWSSSVDSTSVRFLVYNSNVAIMASGFRAGGLSVRCRKDGNTLTIGITGGGTVDPVGGTYAVGAEVELTATPAEGWAFSTWSGDVPDNLPDGATVTDSVLTITMDSDKSLTAEFINPSRARDKDTQVVDVVNPTTGATWMDRNLGASQVATSSTDAAAYGDLYQWGRGADGHQKRTSSTRTTLSSSDWPGHSDFILTSGNPHNWRSSQNDNLWQGADGINNPCPAGYRLPTEAEWDAERQSWSSNDSDGAYESPLKLPMAGYRYFDDGTIYDAGSYVFYWSSSVDGNLARYLEYNSGYAGMGGDYRASGKSVRCIKDVEPS